MKCEHDEITDFIRRNILYFAPLIWDSVPYALASLTFFSLPLSTLFSKCFNLILVVILFDFTDPVPFFSETLNTLLSQKVISGNSLNHFWVAVSPYRWAKRRWFRVSDLTKNSINFDVETWSITSHHFLFVFRRPLKHVTSTYPQMLIRFFFISFFSFCCCPLFPRLPHSSILLHTKKNDGKTFISSEKAQRRARWVRSKPLEERTNEIN